MNKEEKKREYNKKYRDSHKEEYNNYMKNYYNIHKENYKKYYECHKDKYSKNHKKYYEDHKEYLDEKNKKYGKYQRYFRKNYSRFISLKNYLTIMKLGDDSLKHSIMIKLGKGIIDQDEAVALSGMTFTDEDQKELDEWFKTCKCKSNFS